MVKRKDRAVNGYKAQNRAGGPKKVEDPPRGWGSGWYYLPRQIYGFLKFRTKMTRLEQINIEGHLEHGRLSQAIKDRTMTRNEYYLLHSAIRELHWRSRNGLIAIF